MPKVLHVGPHQSQGGMATVMRLLNSHPPEGWQSELLSTHSQKGFFSKLSAWLGARRYLKRFSSKFDIIHIHCAADFSFRRKVNLAKIAQKNGVPVVFQIHSGKFDSWVKGKENWVKGNLKPYSTVVLSEGWKEKLNPLIGEVKVVVNPVDPEIKNLNKSREKKSMLLLGRPDPVKGHRFAFELARQMRVEGWTLNATGSEHQEENIEGLGWISEDSKFDLLSKATVLLVPSSHEGQPMVILEAMAAGCPILASDKVPDLASVVVKAEFENLDEWRTALLDLKPQSMTDAIANHSIKEVSNAWGVLYDGIKINH
jgi:glycosyltransferase involved in cell wall biosynthesis